MGLVALLGAIGTATGRARVIVGTARASAASAVLTVSVASAMKIVSATSESTMTVVLTTTGIARTTNTATLSIASTSADTARAATVEREHSCERHVDRETHKEGRRERHTHGGGERSDRREDERDLERGGEHEGWRVTSIIFTLIRAGNADFAQSSRPYAAQRAQRPSGLRELLRRCPSPWRAPPAHLREKNPRRPCRQQRRPC